MKKTFSAEHKIMPASRDKPTLALKAGFNHLIFSLLPSFLLLQCERVLLYHDNLNTQPLLKHDQVWAFIFVTAGTTPLTENYLYFANRQRLVHVNRDGSGTQIFTLNTTNAIAVDYDIRYIIQTNL